MIHQILMDYRDSGDYFRISIESPKSSDEVCRYFLKYSHDVRYWRSFETRRNCDKGTRVIPVGTIVDCGYFGTKIGYNMRFEAKEGKLESLLDTKRVVA